MDILSAVFATFCCSVFLIVGVLMLVNGIRLQKGCTKGVTAVIVDMIEKEGTDDDGDPIIWYYPVYQYTVNGVTYERESSMPSSGKSYNIGQKIPLKYNPSHPGVFLEPGESKSSILISVIFVAVSLGIIIYVWSIR